MNYDVIVTITGGKAEVNKYQVPATGSLEKDDTVTWKLDKKEYELQVGSWFVNDKSAGPLGPFDSVSRPDNYQFKGTIEKDYTSTTIYRYTYKIYLNGKELEWVGVEGRVDTHRPPPPGMTV